MTPAHPALQTLPVQCSDGHQFQLQLVRATPSRTALLFLPALGVAARHYLPLAHALARHGISVCIHEWRGHGSSTWRADRQHNWGFAQLLQIDLPASLKAMQAAGLATDTLGGHSLGGQLSCCLAGTLPSVRQLLLIGTGSPWWKAFPSPLRWRLPLAYAALPTISRLVGHLPGKQLGFGGREASQLIADWALVGRSGHYCIPDGVEDAMRNWQGHCVALTLRNDWMAPASSMQALTGKLPGATLVQVQIDPTPGDPRTDHFSWMKQPQAVVEAVVKNAKNFSQNR